MSAASAAISPDRSVFLRVLLGAATALVVARPLVAGEDPGRLGSPEASSGQILNPLWLIVAGLTAGWFAWTGRTIRFGGIVALGLLIVAALVGLSAGLVDCYKFPAVRIACEWGVLPIVFVLIRELTADHDPQTDSAGGLFAAMLASGVSVAAFTLFQTLAAVAQWKSPDLPMDAPKPLPPGDEFLGPLTAPVPDWIARGTFERSDTLVGFLLLLLPVGILFALRGRGPKLWFGLAGSAAMIVALLLAARDFVDRGLATRINEGWATAGRLIGERPLLGVGPGNFERLAPRLQPEHIPAILPESWGSYAELAATCGLPAAMALVFALGCLLFRGFSNAPKEAPETEAVPTEPPGERTPRWEFYLGGAFGLLLGLGLRVNDLPGAEPSNAILYSATGAIGRALIWFLAFALFEGITWPRARRAKALLAGVALLAVFALVSGALLRPVLLQMLAIIAAIALSGGTFIETSIWLRPLRWPTVPVVLAFAWAYFVYIAAPAFEAGRAMRHAHMAAGEFRSLQYDIDVAPTAEKQAKRQIAISYVARNINKPMRDALYAEPGNVNLQLESVAWFRAFWKLVPISKRDDILKQLAQTQALDPHGTDPLLRELQLRLTFATFNPKMFVEPQKHEEYATKLRNEQFAAAEALIPRIVERDPALEARLRFQLAKTMIEVKDDDWHKQGIKMAAKVLELDERAQHPRWMLTDAERAQVRKWSITPK